MVAPPGGDTSWIGKATVYLDACGSRSSFSNVIRVVVASTKFYVSVLAPTLAFAFDYTFMIASMSSCRDSCWALSTNASGFVYATPCVRQGLNQPLWTFVFLLWRFM